MKSTLSTNQIVQNLLADNNAKWSRAGATALAEYLEEIEQESGEEIEFDACAIRCDFAEYSSLSEWASEYFAKGESERSLGIEGDDDDETKNRKTRDFISDHGTLLEFSGGIIVSQF